MELPSAFTAKMKELLRDDYEAYETSFHKPHYYGIRVNTHKISVKDFQKISPFEMEEVPWCDQGFYVDKECQPAKHPYYHAGLYYIQEPSAMTPGAFLPVEKGDRILDLCAAPGGKSTQLASRLDGTGLLVSNDISVSRTRALVKNLELFGTMNGMVVSESPDKLENLFPQFFDKILVDAPCSGEGMFRKGNKEIRSWEERGIEPYVAIQKEIVINAVHMLKPGGMLLYSTCTFSPEEDEQMIEYLMEQEDLKILELPQVEGFDHGHPEWTKSKNPELKKCVRLWPHKIKGEGHFVALLQKGGTKDFSSEKVDFKNIKLTQETREFLNQISGIDFEHGVYENKGKLYKVSEGMPKGTGLRMLRQGLYLGEVKKNRFEPSQALAMALTKEQYCNIIDFSLEDERVIKYLKGETLSVETKNSGMYLVCIQGFPLGWGKVNKNSLKNKYAPSWRWL
ncbi:MAG: RsmB/NOP family class I SAM-dependent RNA methyltransferase [Anaerostipes sp.]|jgi:NOL1/NOP2/sun family putative RNA methylase|nr:RsmB/NOP family class I SAM-dependent RNA methyltransferase [Anaerostipes sp.]